jgi:hypothetical protein
MSDDLGREAMAFVADRLAHARQFTPLDLRSGLT